MLDDNLRKLTNYSQFPKSNKPRRPTCTSNVLIYACKALVISNLQAKAILLLSLLFRIINKRLNRKNSFDISLPSLDDDDVCIIGYRYNATEVKIVLEYFRLDLTLTSIRHWIWRTVGFEGLQVPYKHMYQPMTGLLYDHDL